MANETTKPEATALDRALDELDRLSVEPTIGNYGQKRIIRPEVTTKPEAMVSGDLLDLAANGPVDQGLMGEAAKELIQYRERWEPAMAEIHGDYAVRLMAFRKALAVAGLHGHYSLFAEHFGDEEVGRMLPSALAAAKRDGIREGLETAATLDMQQYKDEDNRWNRAIRQYRDAIRAKANETAARQEESDEARVDAVAGHPADGAVTRFKPGDVVWVRGRAAKGCDDGRIDQAIVVEPRAWHSGEQGYMLLGALWRMWYPACRVFATRAEAVAARLPPRPRDLPSRVVEIKDGVAVWRKV